MEFPEQIFEVMAAFQSVDLRQSFATTTGATFKLRGIDKEISFKIIYKLFDDRNQGYSFISTSGIVTRSSGPDAIGLEGFLINNLAPIDAAREAFDAFNTIYFMARENGESPSLDWIK